MSNILDTNILHLPETISVPTHKVLWKIVARNNGTFNLTTGVKLQLTWSTPVIYHRRSDVTDAAGQTFGNGTAAGTFFNIATDLWTVGGLAVGQEKTLIIETSLPVGTDLSTALPLTLTKTIIVDGFTDNVSENNESTDVLLGACLDIDCGPTAAAVDGIGCLCSVANNDTPCNFGVTKWEIVPLSGVNTDIAKLNFNTATGEYTKYLVNPGIDGTFKYKIFCLVDGVVVSGPFEATETMTAIFDTNQLNHHISNKKGTDLTAAEIATIKTQPEYSLLTDAQIQAYCWNTLLNGQGVLVGGWALDCNSKQDARTFFECSSEPCVNTPNPCPTCPQGSLPTDVAIIVNAYADYEEEIGDTIYVKHPNAYSVYKWNGSQWVKWSCGCIFTISQDADNLLTLGTDNAPYLDPASLPTAIKVTGVDVTGTTTKTITITNSDGSTATDTFTDLDTDTTYILDGDTTPGTIYLRDASTNAIISTVVLPIGSGQTYVQVSDTCSLNLEIVGDGSMANPYIISGEILTGSPVPLYVSGTVAPGSSHTVPDVGVLFAEGCGAGCTATYIVIGYPDAVFENVVLTGITLTYDIKANAPGGGTHFIEIEKTCA